MSQALVLVDKWDRPCGQSTYWDSHSGRGKHHRGFAVLLFDSEGKVLLQRRKHVLFDNFWDLTAISHPEIIAGKIEDYEVAAAKALKREMGIESATLEKVGEFNYFAKDKNNAENEFCAIFVGKYDGLARPNSKFVYGAKRVLWQSFISDISKNPEKYTPWAVLAAKQIRKMKTGGELNKTMRDFLAVFEPYLEKYFSSRVKSSSVYPPLVRKFYENIENFGRGGKKLRAFLVYLGYLTGGGSDIQKILPICAAVEVTHSFLLIHDDVIDRSDMRRGKQTMHKLYERLYGPHYGLSQAILAGDIACFEAFKLVSGSSFSDKLKTECQKRLVGVLLETAYGEALDVEYAYKKATLLEVSRVTDLKTARYSFVGPLTIGAGLAKATEAKLSAFRAFGLAAGAAFQLQDDILGVFGDEKTIGKSILSDMREGKNTILIHRAREMSGGKSRNTIDKLWGRNDASFSDLLEIRKLISESGALEACRVQRDSFLKKAKKIVLQLGTDSKVEAIFYQLLEFIGARDN